MIGECREGRNSAHERVLGTKTWWEANPKREKVSQKGWRLAGRKRLGRGGLSSAGGGEKKHKSHSVKVIADRSNQGGGGRSLNSDSAAMGSGGPKWIQSVSEGKSGIQAKNFFQRPLGTRGGREGPAGGLWNSTLLRTREGDTGRGRQKGYSGGKLSDNPDRSETEGKKVNHAGSPLSL